jgi:hypothetical protein
VDNPLQVWNTRAYKQEAECSDNEGVEEVLSAGDNDAKFAPVLVFGWSAFRAQGLACAIKLFEEVCVLPTYYINIALCSL